MGTEERQAFFSDSYLGFVSSLHPGGVSRVDLGGGGFAVTFGDLLTFRLGPLRWTVKADYCAAPPPFGSVPGVMPADRLGEAARLLEKGGRGFMVMTGFDRPYGDLPGWSWKRHYPTVDLDLAWGSFDVYLSNMRSHYRRKISRALARRGGLEVIIGRGSAFNREHYLMYSRLMRRVKNPQHELPFEYFRDFPLDHAYVYMKSEMGEVGWALLVPSGDDLWFLQPAYREDWRNRYDTYLNLLIETVRYGIEAGRRRIRFGQEAAEIKECLGGRPAGTHLAVKHPNPAVNALIQRTGWFDYRRPASRRRVFRDED